MYTICDFYYSFALSETRYFRKLIRKVSGYALSKNVQLIIVFVDLWHKTTTLYLLRSRSCQTACLKSRSFKDTLHFVFAKFQIDTFMYSGHSWGMFLGSRESDDAGQSLQVHDTLILMPTFVIELEKCLAGRKLDCIIFDTCCVGCIEGLFGLDRVCKYCVAAPSFFCGCSFLEIRSLYQLKKESMLSTMRKTCHQFIRHCAKSEPHLRFKISLSLIDTERIANLWHYLLTDGIYLHKISLHKWYLLHTSDSTFDFFVCVNESHLAAKQKHDLTRIGMSAIVGNYSYVPHKMTFKERKLQTNLKEISELTGQLGIAGLPIWLTPTEQKIFKKWLKLDSK